MRAAEMTAQPVRPPASTESAVARIHSWAEGRRRSWWSIIRILPQAGPAVPVAALLNLVIGLLPLAFVIANLIIYWSGFEVIWKLGIVLVIGYILIGVSMAYDKQRPPLDWKSAQWLPVYLIGMGIISWQGQFGPNNTNRIPFWWDMAIVAVFCLVIYYWAMATKLSREEMLDLINRQSVHSAEDNLPPAPTH